MLRRLKVAEMSLALIAFAFTANTFGQVGAGELSGTVTNQNRAAIPHASVKLVSSLNGQTRDTVTTSAGDYHFTALPISGVYTLTITAPGFESFEANHVVLTVGTITTQDAVLTVGSATEVVQVLAQTVEQVQTDTSAVSQLIDSSVWKSSPLETRTQNAFINLVAGATPDDPNSTTYRGAAVDGARTGTGNYLLEGMDNNEQGQGGVALYGVGGAALTLSPDAIEEYRVITHDAPAVYGRAGGFATDTVLKSGTNSWHGSLFEYNRVQALAANHWFSNNASVKDALVRNQFGGSIGGPIKKDKTFFYATLEIHHLRDSSPTTNTTTTQNFIDFVTSGAFESFMEGTTQQDPSTPPLSSGGPAPPQIGICPALTQAACPGAFAGSAKTGPIFSKLDAAQPTSFPHPTVSGLPIDNNVAQGLITAGALRYPVPVYTTATLLNREALNQNRGSVKFDHTLTAKDQLNFVYAIDQIDDANTLGGGDGVFGPAYSQIGGAQFFTANATHAFSPSLINVFRAGYLRHVSNFIIPSSLLGAPSVYAVDPLESSLGHSDGLPQYFTENQFTYQDSLAKTIRAHALTFGFQYMRTRNGSSFFNDTDGTIAFNGVEDVVTDGVFGEELDNAAFGGPTYGSIYEASGAIDPSTNTVPNVYRGYRANEVAVFAQDDWKVAPRLTINAGLRWDYFGPPHNAQPGFDSNVYFGTFGAPISTGNPFFPTSPLAGALQGSSFIQKNSNLWNKDTNNFGPRVGFSYDLTGKGKFVTRGGFGIGFDRLYNNAYENLRFNPPRYADNSVGYFVNGVPAGPTDIPNLYTVPFSANATLAVYGAKPNPRHIDQRLVTAYYEQANFGFEYQLAKGYLLETNYVGTFGRKLVGLLNINTFPGRNGCPEGGGSNTDGSYPAGTPCANAGFPDGFSSSHVTSLFNSDYFRNNGFNSNYNAVQVSIRKAYANGLRLSGNYTYGKAMDEVSDVFRQRNGAAGTTDSQNPAADYGPADFDVTHRAVVNLVYEEQWKKQNLILGGWSIAPILTLSSGYPVALSDSAHDPNQDGSYTDRPQYLGTGKQTNAVHSGFSKTDNAFRFLSAGSFGPVTCPSTENFGIWCDSPTSRDAIHGPHTTNLDFALLKHFNVLEHQTVTFEANFFNIFNHANFGSIDGNIADGDFGNSQSSTDPRIIQFALRYDF
jgi:Carboxypeptidase regulatory-like domain